MMLHELRPGQSAVLCLRPDGDSAEAALLRRGVSPTAETICLFSAPSGDPTAYRMGKVTFALRRETAEKIRVYDRAEKDAAGGMKAEDRRGAAEAEGQRP